MPDQWCLHDHRDSASSTLFSKKCCQNVAILAVRPFWCPFFNLALRPAVSARKAAFSSVHAVETIRRGAIGTFQPLPGGTCQARRSAARIRQTPSSRDSAHARQSLFPHPTSTVSRFLAMVFATRCSVRICISVREPSPGHLHGVDGYAISRCD